MNDQQGVIFDVSRFCTDDGPGIRTTIFLKGCPLHCDWCHNPEGLSPKPQLSFEADKCTVCGMCATVCPQGCHTVGTDGHRINLSACITCGRCTEVCSTGALQMLGRLAKVDELVKTVEKDRSYYGASGGGVTLSGGEVLFQPDFAAALLREFRSRGIHTCIETSGIGSKESLQKLLPFTDLALLDFKLGDMDDLRRHTGADLAVVIRSADLLSKAGIPIVLRCPIIGGVNDTTSHIKMVGSFAASCDAVIKVELLPYHTLGQAKAQRLGMPYTTFLTPWKQHLEAFAESLRRETGKPVSCHQV